MVFQALSSKSGFAQASPCDPGSAFAIFSGQPFGFSFAAVAATRGLIRGITADLPPAGLATGSSGTLSLASNSFSFFPASSTGGLCVSAGFR